MIKDGAEYLKANLSSCCGHREGGIVIIRMDAPDFEEARLARQRSVKYATS